MNTSFSAILLGLPKRSNWDPATNSIGFQVDYFPNCTHFPRVQSLIYEASNESIDKWVKDAKIYGFIPLFVALDLSSPFVSHCVEKHPGVRLVAPDIFPVLLKETVDWPDGPWIDRLLAAMGQLRKLPKDQRPTIVVDTGRTSDLFARDLSYRRAFGREFRYWLEDYLLDFSEQDAKLLSPELKEEGFLRDDWQWDGSLPDQGVLYHKLCPTIMLNASWNDFKKEKIRLGRDGVLKFLPFIPGLTEKDNEKVSILIPVGVFKSWLGQEATGPFFEPHKEGALPGLFDKVRQALARLKNSGRAVGVAGMAGGADGAVSAQADYRSFWGEMRIKCEVRADELTLSIFADVPAVDELRVLLESGDQVIEEQTLPKSADVFIGRLTLSRKNIPTKPVSLRLADAQGAVTFFEVDLEMPGNDEPH